MEIKISVPDGKSGAQEVSSFSVSELSARKVNLKACFEGSGREIEPGTFDILTHLKEGDSKKFGVVIACGFPLVPALRLP